MQPVLVGSTAASQLTPEPIATGVGGVNRRGRRSRHERSALVGSTTSDGANNEQSVLVGSNAVVDGADRAIGVSGVDCCSCRGYDGANVLVGSNAVFDGADNDRCWWGRLLLSQLTTEPIACTGVGGVDCCCRS